MTSINDLLRPLPAALRPYVEGETLRFRSRGPHRYIWFAGLLAAGMWFSAMIGVFGVFGAARDGFAVFGIVVVLTIAASVTFSIVYTAWGSVEIQRVPDAWIIRTRVGPWSRERKLPFSRVSHVDLVNPDPLTMARPGIAGEQLRIYLRYPDAELQILGGLCLERDVLSAIIELMEPPLLGKR